MRRIVTAASGILVIFLLVVMARAQPPEVAAAAALQTVRVGYLHTVAVDENMWVGMHRGYYRQQGLDLRPIQFQTGIALSQALAGGSLDVGIMGAVISNFPARGLGEIFLANDIESNTAQLWVNQGSGIKSVGDLAGKEVATTLGTTANVFLYTAAKAHGVDYKAIKVLNFAMPAAVNAFIAHKVPAVALWVPFDLQVKRLDPTARMIDSAGRYFPQAAILGGWVANNTYYRAHRDILGHIARAWLVTNQYIIAHPKEALATLWQVAYSKETTLADVQHDFAFEKTYTNVEWYQRYQDGTVARWIGQVERVYVDIGGIPSYNPPEHFFDPTIFEQTYRAWAK